MNRDLPTSLQHLLPGTTPTEITVGMTASQLLDYGDTILKIETTHEESNNEHWMMVWLQDKLPVPKVLHFAQDKRFNYLLMSKLPGVMAFDKRIIGNPETVVTLLAKGLKMLWKVDISDCPYTNNVTNKLILAEERLLDNLIDLEEVDESIFTSGRFANLDELFQWLMANQPPEELVFSHGDYCLPNVLVDGENITGFVDLGRAGVADKWQDIALCIRSLTYNLGDQFDPKYVDLLLELLGVPMDEHKLDYYILLDELF